MRAISPDLILLMGLRPAHGTAALSRLGEGPDGVQYAGRDKGFWKPSSGYRPAGGGQRWSQKF